MSPVDSIAKIRYGSDQASSNYYYSHYCIYDFSDFIMYFPAKFTQFLFFIFISVISFYYITSPAAESLDLFCFLSSAFSTSATTKCLRCLPSTL